MVYLLPYLEEFREEDFFFLFPFLSGQRQKKVASYRFLSDKISSACAYLLLRILLQEEGLHSQPFLEKGEHGKPFLTACDKFFSLSHDRAGVLCGLSDKEIGCDIQSAIHFDAELGKRIFSDNERKLLPPGNESEYLTVLWTLKESYGKYRGEGVFSYLQTTDFPFFFGKKKLYGVHFETGKIGQTYYAVCGEQEEKTVTLDKETFFEKIKKLPT